MIENASHQFGACLLVIACLCYLPSVVEESRAIEPATQHADRAADTTSAISSEDRSNEDWSNEDRSWWAFQPVRRPPLPQVDDDSWPRGAIDRFVLERLESQGLEPAPEADRRTLLRRATYDLTGLPPSAAAAANFLADDSPDAYERLIDRLLDSPRYGEQWARYWLDLVRYAESDGYKQDDYRPAAHLYRDYVVRSLNADKPYDQFVREQLAGDEIAPDDRDALIATMFLRHGIYEYNARDVETQWRDILAEITDVTGDVFLGMGISCARCHDHKFDPILQKDYYRLQAFFAPLAPREDMPIASAVQRKQYSAQLQEWESATNSLRRELRELEFPVLVQHAGGEGFEKLPSEIKKMIRLWPGDRTVYEQQIARMASRQFTLDTSILPAELPQAQQQRWRNLKLQLKQYDHIKPAPLPTQPFVVSDISATAPRTVIPGQDSDPVEPGFLSVLDPAPAVIEQPDQALQTTGRRTALARWITSPDNPLTTRVIANRIWHYHFGRGLAANASDFGRLGETPSHLELLDWLTSELLEGEWRLKSLHRRIMTSAAYRQAAGVDPSDAALFADSRNRLVGRRTTRRLRAEEIRDSVLAVTGELDLTSGGAGDKSPSNRRAIYLTSLRNSIDPLLGAFDLTDGQSSVSERNVTTTPTQALLVINGPWIAERADVLARRVAASDHEDPRELAATAYHLAYSRAPTEQELTAAAVFLQQATRRGQQIDSANSRAEAAPDDEPADFGHNALVDLCHTLLCSNEFIYVD